MSTTAKRKRYEPTPKGYRRMWLIVADHGRPPSKTDFCGYDDRSTAELDCGSYEFVVPVDVPLSVLKRVAK